MVARKLRSSSLRKVFVKTPGGRTTVHYVKKKPSKLKCGGCGKELHGVPRDINSKFANLPKTKKRPERPYGGVLCSKCMRIKLMESMI